MNATGSKTARIAARYPSDETPRFMRNDNPTENVTAPTAPYVDANAYESKMLNFPSLLRI